MSSAPLTLVRASDGAGIESCDVPRGDSPALDEGEFLSAVRLTPLVAIDLIVADEAGRVLVGYRRNRPARGSWFVPGGRIRKNETLDAAFTRIVEAELGVADVVRSQASFYGLYEHHYPDNFAGREGVPTHYVVLAHIMTIEDARSLGRPEQHSEYAWLWPDALLARDDVHENTKAYFR
ncbi:colanic acid biosynthesis protein WcaH [Paraburkholderia bannensis]|uniref:Colanic acid biosynthesis protein WcaH n=1 Tax=Paraburkholderia bannensis TaxID=765414 RepID=A0A7W9WW08_9BURK|nr:MULTISPECIES: GDP-mannose mannosyl hydrolase [Paraburkholderia]MBB3260934.1 colanic acid biosynthesis protein WcaH [Paraburkholderia sp. WP4_3_2]MBB6105971.1 colanic acid biosynthesis protein WcaH [Paraburkholderia bannensis]